MRYKEKLGCRYGLPHDLKIIYENQSVKWEVCQICNRKFRWNKLNKGRIDNKKYLEAHVRNFAQKNGITKRIYHKIYKPDKCKIKI